MKAMSLFSRTCVYGKMNPQVLFFDGHYSHFNDRATHILQSHHISTFILKAGDSTNDQPNDNGTNLKLKIYYGIAKMKWQRQHGTMKFNPAHMKSVLVEMWNSFQQQSACVIVPLAPPDHNTNTQSCLAVTQTPSGTKSEEIKQIARASMAPVAVDAIMTTDPMVILRARGIPSRNLLIRGAAYDNVHKRTLLPIQEIKADEMEMRKRRMVRMPNRDGE